MKHSTRKVMSLLFMSVFCLCMAHGVALANEGGNQRVILTSWDFESSIDGWTFIDNDTDGYGFNWLWTDEDSVQHYDCDYYNAGVDFTGCGHNSSNGFLISGSYTNKDEQVLTPDNWAISPAVTIPAGAGASVSFFAQAQDASYPSEVFQVYAGHGATIEGMIAISEKITLTVTREPGGWLKYEFEIPADLVNGEPIYIAIRHFDCTDQFVMNLDDVSVNVEAIATVEAEAEDITYGQTTELTASLDPGVSTLEYQWYINTANSTVGSAAIEGATAATYAVPTDQGVGTYYYYCVITTTDTDDGEPASFVSNMVTVTVSEAHTHVWATEWSNDATYHWHACTGEGAADDCLNETDAAKAEHTYGDTGDARFTCTVCEYVDAAKQADYTAADNVTTAIDNLPAVNDVTTANREAIEAARAAYNALSDTQKALVSNDTLQKLADVEHRLVILQVMSEVFAITGNGMTYTGNAIQLINVPTTALPAGHIMKYAVTTKNATPEDSLYTTSIPTATDAGTYYVWYKVVGDDDHLDAAPTYVTSTIGRASLSKAEVTLAKTSYVFDGKAKEPAVKKVVLGGRTLKAGTDYTVSYKNNAKAGTATAMVKGKGNYKGTAKATFTIALSKARGLSTAGHPATGALDASWKAVVGATSYELSWRKAGGKWSSKSVKDTSDTVDGLKADGLYELRVRAKAGSATGEWSKVATRWLRKVSSLRAAAGSAEGSIKVSWAADDQATGGYVAYACASKDGAILARKAVSAGKTSATIKGLESGKAYYVKVRPIREVSDITYVGVQKYCKTTVKAK